MRIIKIKGNNKQLIMEQINKDYGDTAMVIGTQEERSQGILGFFRQKNYTVTVAVGDEESSVQESKDPFDGKVFLELNKQLSSAKKEIDLFGEQDKSEYDESAIRKSFEEEGLRSEVVEKLLDGIQITTEDGNKELKRRLISYLEIDTEPLPKLVIFVGLTGVGKTTTIAKLTARKILEEDKKIALFTADTYRIAAVEQLRTYANILGVPLEVIYNKEDFEQGVEKWKEMDHIFVDTAGRSHKNISQLEDLSILIECIDEKQVFLVLNMNTTYIDAKNIIDIYRGIVGDFKLIFTKLDETDQYGNIINIIDYANVPIAYITNGQNVPEDIEDFEGSQYVEQMLGRISYE